MGFEDGVFTAAYCRYAIYLIRWTDGRFDWSLPAVLNLVQRVTSSLLLKSQRQLWLLTESVKCQEKIRTGSYNRPHTLLCCLV